MSEVIFGGENGGAGGSAVPFGPPNNIFGATSGDEDLSTITVANTRAIAEATRDAYDTATSGWIDNYTDISVKVQLYYLDNGNRVVQNQIRVGSNWLDLGEPVIALRGLPGDAATVENLEDGHIPYKAFGAEELVSSGMQVIQATGQILAPRNFGVESGSIDFGDLATMSERTSFMGLRNNESGDNFIFVDYLSNRDAPARRPRIFATTESETEFIAQSDGSTQITSAVNVSYTTTLNAHTNAIKFRKRLQQ